MCIRDSVGVGRPVGGKSHIYRVNLAVVKRIVAETSLSCFAVGRGRNIISVVGEFETSANARIVNGEQINVNRVDGERFANLFVGRCV